jgi:hypothetical protein
MKIGTFINHGTVVEIESVQTMNLHIDKGQVCFGENGLQEVIRSAADSPQSDTESHGVSKNPSDDEKEEDSVELSVLRGENEESAPLAEASLACPFTEAQQKASGIKIQAGVVLALMQEMQPLFIQKVDWLSFYSVLLRRCWLDSNLSAFCRMVNELFGVQLDARTLSADLRINGTDYTRWTDADVRIVRRKQLAADFDTRLTEYFERKRAEVMSEVRG